MAQLFFVSQSSISTSTISTQIYKYMDTWLYRFLGDDGEWVPVDIAFVPKGSAMGRRGHRYFAPDGGHDG